METAYAAVKGAYHVSILSRSGERLLLAAEDAWIAPQEWVSILSRSGERLLPLF